MHLGRKQRAALCFVGGGAVAAQGLVALCQPVVPLRRVLGVRDRIDRDRAVALTFDDGPHPQGTPAVLEALEVHGARATFFLAGEQVERFPAVASEIVAAGHQVALHCYRHRNLLRLGPVAVQVDLERGLEAVVEATGVYPALWRPPYGVLTGPSLLLSARLGLETVLWTRWGRDWQRRATAATIARKVSTGVVASDVLLLHDSDAYSAAGSWRHTADSLDQVLQTLADRGLATAFL